jgi:hypothetical protein
LDFDFGCYDSDHDFDCGYDFGSGCCDFGFDFAFG